MKSLLIILALLGLAWGVTYYHYNSLIGEVDASELDYTKNIILTKKAQYVEVKLTCMPYTGENYNFAGVDTTEPPAFILSKLELTIEGKAIEIPSKYYQRLSRLVTIIHDQPQLLENCCELILDDGDLSAIQLRGGDGATAYLATFHFKNRKFTHRELQRLY
ncbi:hypothetical protein SAMN02745181_2412 [Rubritalea squalenifaciens DSM 18772]|uniref:Uncharacterized protein n=1 Tax=Rubritalea squalenifaciens DSM 18772 TaxID=1123071 RepID=A0A1M6LJE9_9BACT|nr:hypothetical protein [Rubritalea squalenifaciens]SHJ71258.1 hypothetical protein SAMN02745181_2412 [Rubritalea squalenifaciens DSM 18772]